MNSLYQNSLQIILRHQTKEGAFIACPNFKTYQYAWFRDGSFCAHALARAGYTQNAFQFHQWASQTVLRYKIKFTECIKEARSGNHPIPALCFHSRFTLDGFEVPGNWGHHQLDGLGTWLWALGEFQRINPGLVLPDHLKQAAGLVKDYLSALWFFPCSDCWEENETKLHTYTLAAVFAGLESYAIWQKNDDAKIVAEEIRSFILCNCVSNGAFVKSIGDVAVDSNLIGLFAPYHLVDWANPIYQKTLERILKELATPVGLHRYRNDTYYGGGEWVLLTAWMGWAYAQAGESQLANTILEWTEAQASPEGELSEQIPHALFDEAGYKLWKRKWGAIASPLLWSHAKYILLAKAIDEGCGA